MSGTVVVTIDPKRDGDPLRDELEAAGFSAHRNPNARWAFRGPGVVVSLYTSGKLVAQGRGARDLVATYLPDAPVGGGKQMESLDSDLIGTDESGKGDYFGPLVAAAVCIPKGQEKVLAELGVRDSKEVSDASAARAAAAIRAGYPHEIVTIGPDRYNELYDDFGNLNLLLAWATAKAVKGVTEKHPCRNVLSDKFGNERLIANALVKAGVEVNLTQRTKAEINPAVAAASILARDEFVSRLAALGKATGTKLPKGAGSPVLSAARRLYHDGGMDALRRVAKMHFKTTKQVTRELF
ncbi:MAG: ribonuclease HIII [Planctomycetota bacterium]